MFRTGYGPNIPSIPFSAYNSMLLYILPSPPVSFFDSLNPNTSMLPLVHMFSSLLVSPFVPFSFCTRADVNSLALIYDSLHSLEFLKDKCSQS